MAIENIQKKKKERKKMLYKMQTKKNERWLDLWETTDSQRSQSLRIILI